MIASLPRRAPQTASAKASTCSMASVPTTLSMFSGVSVMPRTSRISSSTMGMANPPRQAAMLLRSMLNR